jgi:hypothetical protein
LKPVSLGRRSARLPASAFSLPLLLFVLLGPRCRERSPAPASGEDAPDIGDPFLAPPVDASAAPRSTASTLPAREAGAEVPSPRSKATVRLLDPGQAPRRKLRYAWRRDRKETLTIDLRTRAATESEGERPPEVPLPAVRMVVAIEPTAVGPGGELTYAWRVTASKVDPAPGSNPELAQGMNAEVAAIAHLTGTTQVDARGLARDVVVDPPSIGDVVDAGATGEMVEQIRQTLFDLEPPLPEEEVGRGGRWEKVSRLSSKSAVVTQSETFTLASMAGDHGTVDDVLAQTAPPQEWPSPGGGGAEPARLESMLATGTVRSRFDLTRLVPSTTYAGTTTMVVSGRPGADAGRRVTMILRVDITLSGSTP